MRWSLLGLTVRSAPQECDICGQPLKPERRRPGGRFRKDGRERRDVRAPAEAATGSHDPTPNA
jgi:hypothetical protein